MKLIVNPDTVQIPHVVLYRGTNYSFAPVCDVPDEYGEALKKTHPKIFRDFKDTDKVDLSQYTFKKVFKQNSIKDLIPKLNDEQLLAVFNFAQDVLEGKKQTALSDDAVTLANQFEQLSDDAKQKVLKFVARTGKEE